MSMKTFVNLPVKDLAKTTEFFTKLGFSFNQQFSDENVKCMIISEEAYAMLVAEPFFKGFTQREVADTSRSSEVIVGLSAESREQVDDLADRAVAAGAQGLGDPLDDGVMYMRGFRDLDGHQWSFLYLDLSALPEQP
jgi:predicted lactoylglutathione lyase